MPRYVSWVRFRIGRALESRFCPSSRDWRWVAHSRPDKFVIFRDHAYKPVNVWRSAVLKLPVGLFKLSRTTASRFGSGKVTIVWLLAALQLNANTTERRNTTRNDFTTNSE